MVRHSWARQALAGGYSPYAPWARQSVDALWWLAEVDDWAFSANRENIGEHDPDTIDIAHARWATGTAKTAIDLCVADAAVGNNVIGFWGDALDEFAHPPVAKTLHDKHKAKLPPEVALWLSELLADPAYGDLEAARHAFTHRMTGRTATIRTRQPEGHQDRESFAVRIRSIHGRPDARALVLFSRDVATRHVETYCAAAST
jgi:hypothetical protein